MSADQTVSAAVTPTALMLGLAERSPRHVAVRVYESGVWVEYGWDDVARTVARVAGFAASVGVGPGSVVVLACGSRVEWSLVVWAATGLGATVVAVPADVDPATLAALVGEDPALWVLEGAEPFDGLARAGATGATRLVIESADLSAESRRGIYEWERDVLAAPLVDDATRAAELTGAVAALDPTTVALRLPGEGALELTHADLVTAAAGRPDLGDGDEYLSFLPPTWAVEARLLAGAHPASGAVVSFGSRSGGGLREVGAVQPTVLVAPREWWSALVAMVQRSAAEPAPLAKGPLNKILAGGGDGLIARLARRNLAHRFGFTRLRAAYSLGGVTDDQARALAGLGVPLESPLERPRSLDEAPTIDESEHLEEAR